MKYDAKAYDQLSGLLKIDRDQLDEELIAQAQHFWHVAEAHERAVSQQDEKKLDLEITEVELDKEVREQMAADGERVTEKQVEASVKREDEYYKANQAYISAKAEAGRWSALREAYRHRRDMLIELSKKSQQRRYDELTGAGEVREARTRYEDRRR